MSTRRSAKKKRPAAQLSVNTAEAKRQVQMRRLMSRYSEQIYTPNTWILPYTWCIGFIDLNDKNLEKQYTEFVCHTNNAVFAMMIFEAQMLTEGKNVTTFGLEFNNMVEL